MAINSNRGITEGVIWKQILLFFFPILLGSFFQQMYNTVDTIIVGRFVGTAALAAVGASGPIRICRGERTCHNGGGTAALWIKSGPKRKPPVSVPC